MIKAIASLSIIAVIESIGFPDVHDGPCLLQPVPCDPGDDAAADAEDSLLPLLAAMDTSTAGRVCRNEDDDDSVAPEKCPSNRDDVLSMFGMKRTE